MNGDTPVQFQPGADSRNIFSLLSWNGKLPLVAGLAIYYITETSDECGRLSRQASVTLDYRGPRGVATS